MAEEVDVKPEVFHIAEIAKITSADEFLIKKGGAFMVKFMGRNPTVTFKRFIAAYITFYCRFVKKYETGGAELCRVDNEEQIERTAAKLMRIWNERNRELGLRFCRTKDEETGLQLVVLITESSHKSLIPFTKFSQDEVYLINEYVDNIMKSASGSIDRNLAVHMARQLPNPMSAVKAQGLMDRLIAEKWLKMEEDEGEITLAPRAIAELESYLNKKYLTVSCTVCHALVIYKNVSVRCEKCKAETHASCRKEFAKSVRGEKVTCRENGCGHETPRDEWMSGKGQRRDGEVEASQESSYRSAREENSSSQSQSQTEVNKTQTQSQKRKSRKRVIVLSDDEDEEME